MSVKKSIDRMISRMNLTRGKYKRNVFTNKNKEIIKKFQDQRSYLEMNYGIIKNSYNL